MFSNTRKNCMQVIQTALQNTSSQYQGSKSKAPEKSALKHRYSAAAQKHLF